MSERYIRVFSLPENLYITGTPVIIAAGALLKDTKTNKLLAQLKIQNISQQRIKAATVKISLYDIAGRKLDNIVDYQYLDLFTKSNDTFGPKEPIEILDSNTRSYSVAVSEVVFEDNTVWSSEVIEWDNKLELKALSQILPDKELIKEYQISLSNGTETKYVPYQENGIWVCTCGGINADTATNCYLCNNSLEELVTVLDIEKLESAKNIRLEAEKKIAFEERAKAEAEQKQKEEERRANINKLKKYGIIVACAVIIFVGGYFINENVIKPQRAYMLAEDYYNSQDYMKAYVTYLALDDYRDSEEKTIASAKAMSDLSFSLGNFDEAAKWYKRIDDTILVDAGNGDLTKNAAVAIGKEVIAKVPEISDQISNIIIIESKILDNTVCAFVYYNYPYNAYVEKYDIEEFIILEGKIYTMNELSDAINSKNFSAEKSKEISDITEEFSNNITSEQYTVFTGKEILNMF